MRESGFFRRKQSFAQVSNSALRNKGLSLKAKGLYALIQSYITLEDFVLYKDFLISLSVGGKKSFQSGWEELKRSGYLKQYRIRKPGGYVYEYELLDEPDFTQPALVNIGLNGEIIEQPQKGEGSTEQPQNGGGSKCSRFAPDMVRGMGDNNNIIESNTEFNNIISQSEYEELADGQTQSFINIVDCVLASAKKHRLDGVTPETITQFFDYWQNIPKGKIKNMERYLDKTIVSFFKLRI